jgi:hypothetical protein
MFPPGNKLIAYYMFGPQMTQQIAPILNTNRMGVEQGGKIGFILAAVFFETKGFEYNRGV